MVRNHVSFLLVWPTVSSPVLGFPIHWRHVPVSFWQMKPCVSSVQLRSAQRPVRWAAGLCRTTTQLVWGEGAAQGSPSSCLLLVPLPPKGTMSKEAGRGGTQGVKASAMS